jgi:ABC-type dipeptide/oligopeptide/nickel transport system permease subunit
MLPSSDTNVDYIGTNAIVISLIAIVITVVFSAVMAIIYGYILYLIDSYRERKYKKQK